MTAGTTPAPTSTISRDTLTNLLQAGRAYDFLNLAGLWLHHRPDDHQVRLLTVGEFLKLKLVVPARELLNTTPSASRPQEIDEVRAKLAGLLDDTVPWDRFADRFAANLVAWEARGGEAGTVRNAWCKEAHRFRLFIDANDQPQVQLCDSDAPPVWIPQLGNHRAVAEERPLPDELNTPMPIPLMFDGLDLGFYFDRIYRRTQKTFLNYSPAIYVVEREPALLALAFHLHDWAELLADPRVHIRTGRTAAEQMIDDWRWNPDLPWPSHIFHRGQYLPTFAPRVDQLVREAVSAREREIEASIQDLNQVYAGRDRHWWAKRLDEGLSGCGKPLSILTAVSRHTTFLKHSIRDCKKALETLGHRCTVLTEKSDHEIIGPLTYHNAIREQAPDLFLVLDHFRPEFNGIIPEGLPILTWDQDQLPHVFTRAVLSRIAKHDFVTGCSKPPFVAFGCDPRQYLNVRMPTSADAFGGEPLSPQEESRYVCDVSYVSHASQTPHAFHLEERKQYADAGIHRLLDAMYEAMPEILRERQAPDGQVCLRVLDEAQRVTGTPVRDERLRSRFLWWYLWRLGDRIFRHEALEWVADWARRTQKSFRIYGNGWEKHPTLAEFAAGPAENGRELLCVYRASRINLQLMPAGFLHQRAMDGLASGGFFLTRLVPNDFMGGAIRRLHERLVELGIQCNDDIRVCDDQMLWARLEEFLGPWARSLINRDYDVVSNVASLTEVVHADEALPRLREITFDSGQRFADLADRFLADGAARAEHAREMRDVVLAQFSYPAAIRRMLEAMRDYLAEVADSRARAPECDKP